MRARKNATDEPTSTQAGILRPDELARHSSLERTPCATALDPWVENYWTLGWDLPPETLFRSETLPHPACTLSVELGHPRAGIGADRVVLTGVMTRRFDVELRERGWVHAVKFRPGGLAALAGLDASLLTNVTTPAVALLPESVVSAFRELEPEMPSRTTTARTDAALLTLTDGGRGANDVGYLTVLKLIKDMLGDRTLLRVDQLEARHGFSRRRMQRLFTRYVGISPKWVLARYRMHDVVTALDDGYGDSLASLAASYGFYDQAHFNRDFNALVGMSPSVYRDRRRDAMPPSTG